MKEIILGVISAIVFLLIWFIGGNILISAVCTIICFIVALVTTKAVAKDKKVVAVSAGGEDELKKTYNAIVAGCKKLSAYRERFRVIGVQEDVLESLDTVQKSCMNIVRAVEKDMTLCAQLNDFSSHYLPALINILETYTNVASNTSNSKESEVFTTQVLLFLNQIDDAFDKKYYSLFSKDVLDSNAEMSAMMAIFKSEGLIDNKDFTGGLD